MTSINDFSLHTACKNNDLEEVKLLIIEYQDKIYINTKENKVNYIDIKDDNDHSALYYAHNFAQSSNDYNCMDLLLTNEADINYTV